MNPHELFTLRQVADALGVTPRRVRAWADRGTIDYLQHTPHAERLVPGAELARFARLGYRVRWSALTSAAAIAATSETLSNEGTP